MYTSKVLDDKDTGIYLQNKLACIVPNEEAEAALKLKNFWLEKERADYKNFGYQNDWQTAAIEVHKCIELQHEATNYGQQGEEHVVYCDFCHITWKYIIHLIRNFSPSHNPVR